MFIDQNDNSIRGEHKKTILLFVMFTFVLVAIIITIFFAIKFFSLKEVVLSPKKGGDSVIATSTYLSESDLPSSNNSLDGEDGGYLSDVKVENLMFGDFYSSPELDDFELNDYTLPINSKIDISNYYEISRLIDLYEVGDVLNNNGFVVLPEEIPSAKDNFYSMLEELQEKNIPLVITSDFLSYFYQNSIKKSYKTIEGKVFFENLWNVSNTLYEESKARYERLYGKNKMTNNPFLEASRLETAYLAVILKLLSPTSGQISDIKLSEEGNFNVEEAKLFSIDLPSYLQSDVVDEVNLVKKGDNKIVRSPVLKYYRNYEYFKIPKEYQESVRLNNFYLASQWIHSVFPLYYKSVDCEECLLDKEDWRINMLAALLFSQDFSSNQKSKNEWAQIYKTVSFFDGLRGGLVYLDMNSALQNNFGVSYDLEDEFLNADIEKVDTEISKIQANIISKFKSNKVKGSYDYNSTSTRPKIGVKMLSDLYMPDEYMYKQFLSPKIGNYLDDKDLINRETICRRAKEGMIRCFSSNLDIINLFRKNESKEFMINANYEFYTQRGDEIKLWLDKFDKYAWHDSNYWSTLYLYKTYFEDEFTDLPVFMTQESWNNRVDNFILGSLTYVNSGKFDKLKFKENYKAIGQKAFSQDSNSIQYAYIEPNLLFAEEMKANLIMLNEMFRNMGISDRVDSVEIGLNEVIKSFNGVIRIIKKELNSEELDDEDYEFIFDFVNKYEVVENRDKTVETDYSLTQKINGVDLLLLIYKKNGKKILAGGPVYDYSEGNR